MFILFFLLFSSVSEASKTDLCEDVFSEKSIEDKGISSLMPYEDVKTFIKGFGFTIAEFFDFVHSTDLPPGFPKNPHKVYPEFEGWEEFLGARGKPYTKKLEEFVHVVFKLASRIRRDSLSFYQKNIKQQQIEWMPYEEAKAFIQQFGFTIAEFFKFIQSTELPDGFPENPHKVYPEFEGWEEFLVVKKRDSSEKTKEEKEEDELIKKIIEMGPIPNNKLKIEWMSYKEAQTLVQELGIKNRDEFKEWSKTGKRPHNFPSTPDRFYEEEWEGWGKFLGTGNQRQKEWMPYEEAKAFIQKKNLKNRIEFINWKRTSGKSLKIPFNPNRVYKEEWEGWPVFLGTKRDWMSYEEAKAFIQVEGIKSHREINKWKARPHNFPSSPHQVYQEEWEGWPVFLGTEDRSGLIRDWRPYEKAKAYIREQNIFTVAQFKIWSKSSERPFDFPSDPPEVYKKEWENWPVFLGMENKPGPSRRNWMLYEEAIVLIQEKGFQSVVQFKEWSKSEERPRNFPSSPDKIYKEEWESWPVFLGTAN